MFARTILEFIKDDNDLVIPVTGNVGSGKSKLILALCAYYLLPRRGLQYSLDKYMFLSGSVDDLGDKWMNNEHYTPIQVDEAVDLFYNLDYMKRSSIYLDKQVTKIRKKNKIVFLLIDDIRKLQKTFRDRRARVWIHVLNRGIAIVNVRDKNYYSSDRWCMKQGYKLLNSPNRKTEFEMVWELKKMPTYGMTLVYNDYDTPLWRAYESVKQLWKERKQDGEIKNDAELDKWKNRVYESCKTLSNLKKEKWSYARIGNLFGVTKQTISNWISDLDASKKNK